MQFRGFLCVAFLAVANAGGATAQPTSVDLNTLNDAIGTIERLCLSNRSVKGDLKVTASGLLDKLKKSVSASLGIGGTLEDIRGPIGNFSEEFRKDENEAIRSCLEKYMLRWETALSSDEIVVDKIVLMDGDQVSYEKDACSTEQCRQAARSNRVVLRDELKGELGSENIEIDEYGIFPDWNSPADIEKKNPSLVVLHWSGFERASENRSQRLSCDPIKNNRCSELIVENLSKIGTRSKNDPRFIIYSRNKWLCGDEFRDGLLSRIPKDNPQLASKIGLISLHEDYERGRVLSNKFAIADIRDMASFFMGIPSPFENDPEGGICMLSRNFVPVR